MTAESEYRWKGGFSTEMTSVMQWDPFTELRATMDRLFEEGFLPALALPGGSGLPDRLPGGVLGDGRGDLPEGDAAGG